MADSSKTLDEDAPLASTGPSEHHDRARPVPPSLPARYAEGRLIANGGMGDVWSFRDDVLGRTVAVKVLARPQRATAFEREARVQARLSHPSVVPIHDLGEDSGRPYLVMTHIEGDTLAAILQRQRTGVGAVRGEYNRRRLLTAFVCVCQALAYAHAHGVVHRDLKPENIMLGTLGEVYVLDWGIALIDDGPIAGVSRAKPGHAGTLGYMAPEQIHEDDVIDHRSDIYALGVILFEIVTLARLHPGAEQDEIVASTLHGVDVHARSMAEHAVLPPELEAICRRATATSPDDRHRDVASFVGELERFLDGERDEAGRRALADELVARAHMGLEVNGDRKGVLRDAGRALALAPEHARAAQILRRVLADGVDAMPDELATQIAADDRSDRRKGALIAVAGLGVWLSLFAGGVALGIREPATFVAFSVFATIATGAAVQRAIWGGATRSAAVVAAVAGAAALVLLSRLAGPFMLVPTIAAALMPVFAFDRAAHRRWLFATFALAVLAPAVAETLGWIEPTTVIGTDTIVIHARMAAFSATWSPILLALTSIAALAVSHFAAGRTWSAIKQHRFERVRTAWQLEQVLPERLDDDHR
jgi:eukaryotic-like serine/threonine-protein kinase